MRKHLGVWLAFVPQLIQATELFGDLMFGRTHAVKCVGRPSLNIGEAAQEVGNCTPCLELLPFRRQLLGDGTEKTNHFNHPFLVQEFPACRAGMAVLVHFMYHELSAFAEPAPIEKNGGADLEIRRGTFAGT